MNTPTLVEAPRRASARAVHRSPFSAFLLKDLRLARPVLAAGHGILGILAAFYATLPLFGREAERAFLLAYQQTTLAHRLGELSPIFWLVSALASVFSAVAIASGDSGGRARHLLPALPVPSSLAYASKLAASAVVLCTFLSLSFAVQALPHDAGRPDAAFIGLAVAIGMLWAFAAPLFARNFAGVLVGVVLIPFALLFACAVCAHWLAPVLMRATLAAFDAAPWYHAFPGVQAEIEFSKPDLEDAMLLSAPATLLVVGVWGAWCARGVVLCRRTPQRLGVARSMQLLGVVACAMIAASVGTAARAWTTDGRIASATEAARFHRELSALPTVELVDAAIARRRHIGSVRQDPSRPYRGALVWHAVYTLEDRTAVLRDSSEYNLDRATMFALSDRFASDPDGLMDAAGAALSDPKRDGLGTRLAAARLVGPWTALSVAVHGLAEATDESERAVLVHLIARYAGVLAPKEALEAGRPHGVRKVSLSSNFESWGIPPFAVRAFATEWQYPAVAARASAVLALAALERRVSDGAVTAHNPSLAADRLEIDAETLRRARAAAELPFSRLAVDFNATDASIRAGEPIEDLDDNETLHLRASDLFDPEKTDPSYLSPRE
jgi:hypothetical protein